jgi:putative SOS response-associated peptidase YedK
VRAFFCSRRASDLITIHEEAMPVMLMTPDDVEQWLRGVSVDDALKMQKPAPDDAIVIRPTEKKAA